MQAKVGLVRTRRRHSKEFREQVVAACRPAGVSVAAVALAHGLNAELVRRWIKESAERWSVARRAPAGTVAKSLTVVPLTLAPGEVRTEEAIRIDIRRTGIAVQLAWPVSRVAELSGLLTELLK